MSKLIVGCGYLGLRVARRWLAAGETVWATTRSDERALQLEKVGLRPIVADVTRGLVLPAAAGDIQTTLFAIGFDSPARQSIEDVYVTALEQVLAAFTRFPEKFIYISSTGVYGQSGGEWVDEDSPCVPARAGGRACLAAEQRLDSSPWRDRRIILRLAGLYGPERIPKLAAVRQGEPIASPELGYLNLIHVDDAADVVLAAERRVSPPSVLTVSDGQPVLRGDFYRELAALLNAPPPRFVPPSAVMHLAERMLSDKRVSNQRMRQILDRPLAFPSYREGLAAIVRELDSRHGCGE